MPHLTLFDSKRAIYIFFILLVFVQEDFCSRVYAISTIQMCWRPTQFSCVGDALDPNALKFSCNKRRTGGELYAEEF